LIEYYKYPYPASYLNNCLLEGVLLFPARTNSTLKTSSKD